MATCDDVRSIADELPETSVGLSWGPSALMVRDKCFVLQREPRPSATHAAGERISGLIVLYVPDLETKDTLAGDDSGTS